MSKHLWQTVGLGAIAGFRSMTAPALLSSNLLQYHPHALAGSPLPANLRGPASDSIGATYEVAGRLAAGGVPPAAVGRLEEAANQAFMPAFHAAAFVSAGLLIIAVILFAGWLPAKPETVDWAVTPSPGGQPPTVDQLGAPLDEPAPVDPPPGRRR